MIHQSLIYRDQFGTEPMRKVWSEDALVQRWLDVEAAVAWAEGELGIVPHGVSRKIVRNCHIDKITPAAIAARYRETGHVIVSLIKAFHDAVPDAGENFHLGPTTQDILDTGLTLQIRDALRLLVAALLALEDVLLGLAWRHRDTIMMGRTEGQHAAPITFGYKVAVLASEIGDHLERLCACSERLMILTLFGATGVQSSFCLIAGKKRTRQLVGMVGDRLGLRVPPVCPHHRTDRFAELGQTIALLSSTLGEAGLEIRDLQRTEVAEVSEPWGKSRHSSSTMPQKQNPEASEWLDGLAKLSRSQALALTDIQQQHERDISRLPPQLHAIPNLFLYAISGVESATRIFAGLRVHQDRMRDNLMLRNGVAMAESVMLAVAERSKRKVWAHQLLHDIAFEVTKSDGDFAEALAGHPEVTKYLTTAEVKSLLRPEGYVGTAATQVRAARVAAGRRRKRLKKRFAGTLGNIPGFD